MNRVVSEAQLREHGVHRSRCQWRWLINKRSRVSANKGGSRQAGKKPVWLVPMVRCRGLPPRLRADLGCSRSGPSIDLGFRKLRRQPCWFPEGCAFPVPPCQLTGLAKRFRSGRPPAVLGVRLLQESYVFKGISLLPPSLPSRDRVHT